MPCTATCSVEDLVQSNPVCIRGCSRPTAPSAGRYSNGCSNDPRVNFCDSTRAAARRILASRLQARTRTSSADFMNRSPSVRRRLSMPGQHLLLRQIRHAVDRRVVKVCLWGVPFLNLRRTHCLWTKVRLPAEEGQRGSALLCIPTCC